jgi:PAS domain S-box-containing protein/putative nucleotidyltransferase with HDIG domain
MRFLRDREGHDDTLQGDSGPGLFEPGDSPTGGVGDPAARSCLNDVERTAAEACGVDGFCSVVLDVVGALVVVLDHEGRIVRFNRICEETTGYSFEEVAGAKVWDRLLLPEDAGSVEEIFNDLCSGDYPNQHENCWITKDGRNREIAWSNTTLPNPDGSVRYVIGTGIDITDRQSAEDGVRWRTEDLALLNTLNESANRGDSLREIAHLLALGTRRDFGNHGASLYLLDESHTHLTLQGLFFQKGVAEKIERLIGVTLPSTGRIRLEECRYHKEIMEGGSVVVMNDEEEIRALMLEFVDAANIREALRVTVRSLIPAIQKLLGIHSIAIMPLLSEGDLTGLMGFSGTTRPTDMQLGRLATVARQVAGITRHRRSEEALRLSEATLAEAQRIARIGNWSWDIARDERHWSKEVYRILGRTTDECRPTYENFIEAVHPDDRDMVTAALDRALHTGRRYNVNHRIVWPDGTVRVVHQQAGFSFDENGKPARMVGTLQDVTKQSRAKELQSVLLAIAEAVNRSESLEELLGTVHRELGRLIDTTNFYVALFDEYTGTYTFPYHVDKCDDSAPLGPTHLGKSLTDYVRRRGEAALVDEQFHQELIDAGEVELIGAPSTAWLGVPLKNGGKDIGVVAVQSYEKVSPYTLLDLKLMTFVSDNVAMAVGRKLAEEQVNQRLHMEETVSDIVSGLIRHGVEETNEAISEALASAGALLSAEHCFAGLVEPDKGSSRDAYEWCAERVSPLIYELAAVVRGCFPWLADTAKESGFVRIDSPADIPPEAGALRHLLEFAEVESMLAVPMRDRGQTIGIVCVLGYPSGTGSMESVTFLRTLAAALASALERRSTDAALRSSFESLRATVNGTVDALSRLGEARDPYTAGHQQRVAELACAIAAEMGFPEDRIEGIRVASKLHDIGKIHVPGEILSKPGALDEMEFGFIKTHPKVGYEILRAVEFPWPVAEVALQHHERLDGSGYPQGLSGDEILPEARIVGVADVVEAMCTHRPYRPALSISAAIEELSKNRGRLYGPTAVDACLKLLRTGKLKLGPS